jgi:hypothetical protein
VHVNTSEQESTVTDFLDDKRREISNRMKELQPAVDEFIRLQAAAAALADVGGSASTPTRTRRRGPGRPRGSVNRTTRAVAAKPKRKAARATTRRRAGRRKGSGTRAIEAYSFVQGQPGITIPELAAKMGIKQNYLYRVLPGLQQENKVTKRGRGWFPK